MIYEPFTTIVHLEQDEPLFQFNRISLKAGSKLKVNLEESPKHGDLVVVSESSSHCSIRRFEIINGRPGFHPPLKEYPLILSDVLMGPIIEVVLD